ncbi:MAG: hypothetical protein K5989_02695, partial [Lachnospiraceae bacterium]|nr:hypothetical protein [Lachnospiraceae bacterium]
YRKPRRQLYEKPRDSYIESPGAAIWKARGQLSGKPGGSYLESLGAVDAAPEISNLSQAILLYSR